MTATLHLVTRMLGLGQFASEADPEADYRPTGAIEGLRAIIKRRAP